ncbi:hypothetical protein GCM10027417_11400 [Glutamicibacter endophyticus]
MQRKQKWRHAVKAEAVLSTVLDEGQAADLLRAKEPRLRIHGARLRHHPFAGFEFEIPYFAGQSKRAFALVDYFSGKAFVTDSWNFAAEGAVLPNSVADPGWNSIGFETARGRAKALLSTAMLRRARLAWRGEIREVNSVRTVWKPNWLLDVSLQGRAYRVLVDGLNGGYFFLDS